MEQESINLDSFGMLSISMHHNTRRNNYSLVAQLLIKSTTFIANEKENYY